MVISSPMILASRLASGGVTAYSLHRSKSERGNTFEGGMVWYAFSLRYEYFCRR